MSNEILVDIEEIQSLLNKMITCKDKASAAGAKAKKSIKGFCDEGVSSASSAYRAIKKADEALIQSIDSGISALNQTIIKFKESDESIAKSTEKIPVSQIVVPTTSTKTISSTGNSNSTGSVSTQQSHENSSYSEVRDRLNSIAIPKQPQIRECDGNGKPIVESDKNGKEVDVAGRCNVSALTMLLNRKYALDTNAEGNQWFTPQDVLEGNGCTVIKDWGTNHSLKKGQQFIQYNGKTGNWANGKTYSNGELSYKTVACSKSSVVNEVTSNYNGSYEEYIASVLEKHPEGICLRSASKGHVVTITDYSRDQDGTVHLYCDDPVNIVNGKSHLELKESYVWTGNNFWSGLDNNIAITYVEPVN